MTREIRVAIAGIGNCASSLVQGIEFYRTSLKRVGLMNEKIGPFKVSDIKFVAAFDIDARKVGKDLSEAIYGEPNNTRKIVQVGQTRVKVHMAQPLDGISSIAGDKVQRSNTNPSNISKVLEDTKTHVLVNLTPTGASKASEMYAQAALQAGSDFINATPAKIASNQAWQAKYRKKGAILVGDDIMDQIGSTILHKNLLSLLVDRGTQIGETYQLDIGGGTESQLALDKKRYEIKRGIKTAAVAAAVPYKFPIVAGSSDFVDFMENRRTSYFWIKGEYFAGTDFTLDMRISLEDGPACAGILTDVIRMVRLAAEKGQTGALNAISSYGFKAPPKRVPLANLNDEIGWIPKGPTPN
ncbi:MAG TPA: inositol-3-phosphate synthase [Candidatus Bathyarchaeia archaeon]|nr:inositol-3-phosphate synthase [Candidatus Bathyarchaeia archaeon]